MYSLIKNLFFSNFLIAFIINSVEDIELAAAIRKHKQPVIDSSMYNNAIDHENYIDNSKDETFNSSIILLLFLTFLVFIIFLNWLSKKRGNIRNRRKNYLLNKLGI